MYTMYIVSSIILRQCKNRLMLVINFLVKQTLIKIIYNI